MRGWVFKVDVIERVRRLEWWLGKFGRVVFGLYEVWCLLLGWWGVFEGCK